MIQKDLEESLKGNFVELRTTLIRDVALPDKVKAAIEDKIEAEQSALKYKYTLQQEIKEAERKVIEAQAKADKVVGDAKEQASQIKDQASQMASKIKDQAKSDALSEKERQLTAAKVEIEQEANRAKDVLRKQVAGLAVAGTEQLLSKELDAAKHADLLDDLIKEI